MRNMFGTLTCREAWLTPEQFTFFNLLTDQPHYTECMIETHKAPNQNDDTDIEKLFVEKYNPKREEMK